MSAIVPPTIVEPTLPATPERKRNTQITAILEERASGRYRSVKMTKEARYMGFRP
jgi:hypothetical protein